MSESSVLRRSGCPVFTKRNAVVRCGIAEGDAVPFVIGPHAGKRAATRYAALEMVNVGWFQIGARGLIMATILIEPRNWKGLIATVRGHRLLRSEGVHRRWIQERNRGQATAFEKSSATID
jgi:hypothetical protein